MRKIFGINSTALIEMVSLLSCMTMMSYLFGNGTRFIDLQPHPFWIVVLLMIVQYGTIEALAATFLATFFLYLGNLPSQLVDESTFAYQFRVTLTPFLWFSASFLLGELRMRLQKRLELAVKERDEALQQAVAITENYEILRAMKENIESRFAGQIQTVAATYESVKELETLEPVQIIVRLDNVVKNALNPTKFSVYASGPNGLEATTSIGWTPDDSYSLRFTEKDSLYKEIVINQRLVSLINKEDKAILQKEGVFAAPLVNMNDGTVFGMLKIEEIDFFKIDVGTLETFSALCKLIGSAYSNAVKYRSALQNTIFDSSMGVFSARLYAIMRAWAEAFANRTSTPLTNLSIKIISPEDMKEGSWEKDSKILYELMTDKLPTKKQTPVFQNSGKRTRLEILMPMTTKEESKRLSLKLLNAFQQSPELSRYKFEFESTSLVPPSEKENTREINT